jgi:DNA invertase Pin-like site-specific DNA recombinase
MIACYARVSTSEQNLDRQLSSTSDYAQDDLDAEPAEIDIYRDKSTGTDTSRDGYRELMDDVEAGEIDHVVVHEISRLARSLQDLDRTVDRVTDAGAELHFVRDNLTFSGEENPMERLQMQMLGAFAEWEARVKQMNTKEGIAARREADDDYHHGHPPLGFAKDDGHLIEGENYHDIVATLDMVQKGDLSKRKAAQELGTSRPTIDRALNRAEIYGL